ncbi:MAG: PD-(D/E)XK nuclease family protein [Arcanobacterium sp.]|nr:PD-(D/E)XK nuclease family protein [Arcanobacterium sp.]
MTTINAALSPSRISDFRKCPLKFRFRSIDKLPEPPSLVALRGTLVHSVLEHLFDLAPQLRTENSAQELLAPRWEALVKEDPSLSELFTTESEFTTWFESARPLITKYFTMENPRMLEPIAREGFVNTTLPSGIAIRGIIDRIDQAPNGDLRVVDYKTGKSPRPQYQEEAIFQMRFYATALFHERQQLPLRTQLVYLQDGRTLTYDPTMEDVRTINQEVASVWGNIRERIASGNFETKKGPLCNWCSFQEFCPEYSGTTPEMNPQGAEYLLTVEKITN